MRFIPDTFGVWNVPPFETPWSICGNPEIVMCWGIQRHGVAAWGAVRLLGVVRLLGDLDYGVVRLLGDLETS